MLCLSNAECDESPLNFEYETIRLSNFVSIVSFIKKNFLEFGFKVLRVLFINEIDQ